MSAQLRAGVFAAPDDDAARLVYADWLLERGDPLGDFITLQFARETRELTSAEQRRMNGLIGKHAVSWLGPIAMVTPTDSWRFSRGFIDECELKWVADPALVLRSQACAEWATVRTLHTQGQLDREFFPTALRALRTITGIDENAMIRLATEQPRPTLERADFGFNGRNGELSEELIAALGSCSGLPSLTRLHICELVAEPILPGMLEWLWKTDLGRRLRELAIGGAVAVLPEWISALADPKSAIHVPASFERLIIRPDFRGLASASTCTVEVTRDEATNQFSSVLIRSTVERFPAVELLVRTLRALVENGRLTRVAVQGYDKVELANRVADAVGPDLFRRIRPVISGTR